MTRVCSTFLLVTASVWLFGCDLARESAPDASNIDARLRDPRSDIVPAVGSVATLDVASWNIENFPASNQTAANVADLITSLDFDMVMVEEIASIDSWNELVARLPSYRAVLSSHVYSSGTYQKLGVLYRADTITIGAVSELFRYDSDFPRPALSMPVTFDDGVHLPLSFELMGLHLKAGTQPSDIRRRTDAIVKLDQFVQNQITEGGESKLIILGDYNTDPGEAGGAAVLAPLISQPERYNVRTLPLAEAGAVTFLPSDVMLDQLTTTTALDDQLLGSIVVIPPLEDQYPGYIAGISDHVPVVITIPLHE